MKTDAYLCEDCDKTFDVYQRFCPNCDGEKTLKYQPNKLLKSFLIDLLVVADPAKVKAYSDLCGCTEADDAINYSEFMRAIEAL